MEILNDGIFLSIFVQINFTFSNAKKNRLGNSHFVFFTPRSVTIYKTLRGVASLYSNNFIFRCKTSRTTFVQ